MVDINAPKTLSADNILDLTGNVYDLMSDNGWMKAAVEAGSEMRVLRDNNLEDQPNGFGELYFECFGTLIQTDFHY